MENSDSATFSESEPRRSRSGLLPSEVIFKERPDSHYGSSSTGNFCAANADQPLEIGPTVGKSKHSLEIFHEGISLLR
jgi:hypothetical protein